MPDQNMVQPDSTVNSAEYEALCAARSSFAVAWMDWLRTKPDQWTATHELMATQASIRQIHDSVTGRNIIEVMSA